MIERLNYCWRLFATGGCFAAFGLGGFALWTVVFPVVRMLPGGSRAERVRKVIQQSFAAFIWLMKTLGIMRLEVSGAERLRNCRNVLVLANHPTLIDVVALVSLMPDASCIVKQALWQNPFLGGVVRAAGYLSNSDADRLIDDCAAGLASGSPLIIFPEGTRSRPNQPLAFQRGAAYIALRSAKPILPVLIDCSPTTLTKQEKWYQIPHRPFHLRIKVLDPLGPELWLRPDEAQSIAVRRLTTTLESHFTQELHQWKN